MKKISILLSILVVNLFLAQNVFAVGAEGLAETIAKEQGIENDVAKTHVEAVFAAITSELQKGNEVMIRKFGKFYIQDRAARKGRNPRTGAEIDIPAKKYPKFTSSDSLKQAMN